MLLPGGTQVHVGVEEGREEVHAPAALEHLLAVMRERARLSELGDLALAHAQVAAAVETAAGIEHADVAEEKLCARPGAGEKRCGAHPQASCGWGSGSGARTPESSS